MANSIDGNKIVVRYKSDFLFSNFNTMMLNKVKNFNPTVAKEFETFLWPIKKYKLFNSHKEIRFFLYVERSIGVI